MSEGKTVATLVVNTLRELGVKYVFGVPSSGWLDYMEALRTTDGIEFILVTHEGGAGMMADVCGRLGDAPGVCFGTYGPGATNLATGVGGALLDRSPMIAFTDEMSMLMRGRTTQMGIDHQALFRPLTKKTTRLRADAVKSVLFDAARVAPARCSPGRSEPSSAVRAVMGLWKTSTLARFRKSASPLLYSVSALACRWPPRLWWRWRG